MLRRLERERRGEITVRWKRKEQERRQALASNQSSIYRGLAAHSCNPGSWEEKEGLEVFKTILGYKQ